MRGVGARIVPIVSVLWNPRGAIDRDYHSFTACLRELAPDS